MPSFFTLAATSLVLASTVFATLAPRDESLGVEHDPTAYDRYFSRRLLNESDAYDSSAGRPTVGGNFTVGIIGAGAAGLYAAILLDSLGIQYEILEANTRPGGRIWTYYFDEETWKNSSPGDSAHYDYYDVGAMRFPNMTYMDRVIGGQNNSLFNFINSRVTGRDRLVSIPYIYTANDTFLRYNDRLKRIQSALTGDPFDVRIAEQGTVPGQFAALSPKTVWSEAVVDLTDALTKSFDDGFNKLMEYDSMSVREYLAGKNYTDAEVDWLETMNDATGHYDAAVSQMVLEQWIFTEVSSADWVTFDGGLSRVVNGMIKSIPQPVHYSQRVTAIERETSESLSVSTNDTTRFYHHVINTVPLAAMQVMDMTALELDYGKKLAMRKLNYDPAGKIGMKFKTRWWEHLDQPFKGGQSFSDLPIRRCVYPSYGVNTTDAAGTMIASYTWGQDSSRLGAYMSTPAAIDHLIEITLHDLAAMNNVTQAFLESQFLDAHVWSWYNSEFSGGAFAIFTPGQFSSLLPALLSPAAEGRMHFAGEALSTGHAWIIGALNSAYRTVAEVLAVENRTDLLLELERKWGTVVSFSRCCVL